MREQIALAVGMVAMVVALAACGSDGAGALGSPVAIDCTVPVTTGEGDVRGKLVQGDTCAYLSLPFATAPQGTARFAPPTAAPLRAGVLDAVRYGPDCWQWLAGFLSPAGESEDCLTLNVWRPATDRSGHGLDGLPVMVFIYGGGFTLGGSSWFLYEGQDLTRHGVVVVTINYRLGPFGFLAKPELVTESTMGYNGNWAIHDMLAALEWIHANIAGFGGDPQNVTIFGESAGGWSVCTLLATPGIDGLVRRAIMQSGNCTIGELEANYAKMASYAIEVGCPATGPESLSCLRAFSGRDLRDAAFVFMNDGMYPVVDGALLKAQPFQALAAGNASGIDLMAGYNRDELLPTTLVPGLAGFRFMPWAEFWEVVADVFGSSDALRIAELYPQADYPSPAELWSDVLDDLTFGCHTWEAVAAQAGQGGANVYQYEFSVGDGSFRIEDKMGSFHSLELPFVFGNLEYANVFFHDTDAAEFLTTLSERIQRYWTRFARTGDPNGDGDPVWPAFTQNQTTMRVGPDGVAQVLEAYKTPQCAFWNARMPNELAALFDYLGWLPEAIEGSFVLSGQFDNL